MVLPKTTKQNGTEVISLYLPQLRDHITVPESTTFEVKRLVVEMGGQKNASCRFMKLTSLPSDTTVDSKNSRVCKSVLQVPRKPISSSVLLQLDAGI